MLVLRSLSFPLHETIWISDRQRNVVLFQEQSLYSPFACFFFELGQNRKNLAKSAFCYSKKKTTNERKWETSKDDNAVFVLFENEETNKYFKASQQLG